MKQIPTKPLLITDSKYPKNLKEIKDPPSPLYVLGNEDLNSLPLVSIIGTRKASQESLNTAFETAKKLSKNGVGIISGLAYGIDRAAHLGALSAGGKTWAVMAHGLHRVYPTAHFSLANDIIKNGGGLLSEYPPGESALPYKFLRRNRIVSGLSLGIIVIEVPKKSGTQNTISHALNQGREVFVVPHHPSKEAYQGSLALLRDGARLIRDANDVLEDLGLDVKNNESNQTLPSVLHEKVFACISNNNPIEFDKILNTLQINVQDLQVLITDLEILGLIKEKNGCYFKV